MPRYEYLTVPAPRKGEKAKGIKTAEGRIAQAMQTVLNAQGAEGWEYLRADLLPMEERSGIASKTVNYHTVLVFRRAVDAETEGRDFGAYPELDEIENEAVERPEPLPENAPESAVENMPEPELESDAVEPEAPARPVLRAEKPGSEV